MTGTKRFLFCLALTAGVGSLPTFAATEGEQKPHQNAALSRPEAPQKPVPAASEAAKAEPTKAEPAKAEAAKPEPANAEKPAATGIKVVTAKTGMDGDGLAGEANVNVRKYCTNIAPAATDARFAWQTKKLQELEGQIKARISELDAKQAELKAWLDKRDQINKEAREALVGIYAKMKPENAAAQIAALDDTMATAVLAALPPRQAGAIFSEITPADRAAKLAGLLANPMAQADKKP